MTSKRHHTFSGHYALYHREACSWKKNLCINIALLCAAILLFCASFPNNILRFGWGWLSFIAILPVYILVHRNSLLSMPLWGFLYGFICYIIFNVWLSVFDPNAALLVPAIYAVYFVIHFFVIKILMLRFPNKVFLLLPLCWVAYEYLRTLGYLGYSFGVIAYTLSFYPILIQTADIFGIWFLCLLVVFFSSLLYKYLYNCSLMSYKERSETIASIGNIRNIKRSLSISSIIYVLCFILVIIYGVIGRVDYSQSPTKKIALLQHDIDPWEGGIKAYTQSLNELIRLSEELLAKHKHTIHMVVWSETAFVPSIDYHLKYKENPRYVALINRLLRFFEKHLDTFFLIGNGEGKRIFDEDNSPQRVDYNASILFKGNKRYASYYKLHLVPFTEHFPYTRSLAFFYNILKETDVHFWESGTEYTIFDTSELRFATPICFEDGFGDQNARFVAKGAEILINISNDAWSRMEVNAMQHLQLSIMRAVENRRTFIRSTNAGMTAVIDPNGNILRMLPSFTRDSIVYDVPIYTERTTFYTQYKDFLAHAILMIVIVLSIYAIITLTIQKIHK